MAHPDICIAGAGIIGLSLALELHHRGAQVTVLDRDIALSHASTAAAGMLAADDPDNLPQLQSLSALSISLYPKFLSRVEALSGLAVPFQTSRTLQAHPSYADTFDPAMLPYLTPGTHRFSVLNEHSIDPRQLAVALLAAVRQTSIKLLEHTPLHAVSTSGTRLQLNIGSESLLTQYLIHTQGAWSFSPVTPRKGQVLIVALPASLPLREVIRTPEIYIVPRIFGPHAGCALIGATIEDAGFDTTTHAIDLAHLRALAAQLLPALADETQCPAVAQWAGLRPATPDALPLLGPVPATDNQFLATGHYRNGILLAPATAHVMAQLLFGETPEVDLTSFAPARFLTKN